MNKVITTLILALGFYGAQAQVANPLARNPERSARIKKLMAPQQQQSRAAYKTTATYWRLQASASWQLSQSLSLEESDSSSYKYSNGRGSNFTLSSDLFINDYGMSADVNYDTAVKFRNQGSGLELQNRYLCEYDGSQQKSKFTEQVPQGTGFNNNTQIAGTRDGNGNIIKETSLNWTGSAWDTTKVVLRTFNTQNKITFDSSYNVSGTVKIPNDVTYYTYDGNGNLTASLELSWSGTTWDSMYRYTNTYYTNNTLQTTIEEEYNEDSTKWINIYRDSMGYGTSTDFYIYNLSQEWDTLNSVWLNSGLETRTVNGSGLPATVSFSQWNDTTTSFQLQGEGNILYDGNQNLTNVVIYAYFGGIKFPTPVFLYNYHYEHYFKTGVDDINPASSVTIYPNPATTQLNVNTTGLKDARISLTNMAGQAVNTISAHGNISTVNVSGLAPGNYILSVESADAAPAKQMVTVR